MIFLLLQLLAAQTPTNVIYANAVVVTGPGTNNWIVISNGSIWLPPFTFPSEDGGDAQRGGIYFGAAGSDVPNTAGAHYLLNIVHRGVNGGQELISHQSIALEEQSVGEIILGNDIETGGIVRVRFSDFGGANLRTNVPGHAHPIVFDPRIKFADGTVHGSCPGIIAYHGGGPDEAPQGTLRGWGWAGRGELAFYSFVPWSDTAERLIGGVEMGRMKTNGWDFRGSLTRQRRAITNLTTTCTVDLGSSYLTDVTLTTNTVVTSTNSRASADAVQSSVVMLRAGPYSRTVRFPNWIARQPAPLKAPIFMPANSKLWIDLDCLAGETYATFHSTP